LTGGDGMRKCETDPAFGAMQDDWTTGAEDGKTVRTIPAGGMSGPAGRRGGLWQARRKDPGGDQGSLTLEAAVMLPAFVTILLAFSMLIRIVMVETALQSVASDSVKQLSGIWLPFEEQLKEAGSAYGKLDPEGWSLIPEPVKPLLNGFGNWRGLADEALQRALSAGLTPAVRAGVPEAWRGRLIDPDRIRVEEVAVPHVNDHEMRFGFTVVYEMPVSLPFYQRTLVIRKSAYERVWYGI